MKMKMRMRMKAHTTFGPNHLGPAHFSTFGPTIFGQNHFWPRLLLARFWPPTMVQRGHHFGARAPVDHPKFQDDTLKKNKKQKGRNEK